MARKVQPKFQRELEIEGSDLVRSVQYDPSRWILDATLMDGKRYRYRHISPKTFTLLVTSTSAGKVFNERVKLDFTGLRKATRLPSTEAVRPFRS